MKSEEIVVKNKPVYVDKFFGKPIRSVKRPISTQGGIKSEPIEIQVKKEPLTDAADESSTESTHKCKSCKMRFVNLRSLNKHARVHIDEEDKNSDIESNEEEDKNEQSTDADDESSTESSNKCKTCKMRFVNLRSLNKHARIHNDEEEKKSDVETKEAEVKSEPMEPENARSKQESTIETGYMEQQAIKRRNKPTFMPSISLLKHEPAEPMAQIEPQTVDNRSSEKKSRKSKKTK